MFHFFGKRNIENGFNCCNGDRSKWRTRPFTNKKQTGPEDVLYCFQLAVLPSDAWEKGSHPH